MAKGTFASTQSTLRRYLPTYRPTKDIKKKFQHIIDIILNGLRSPEHYDKEEPNDKCKGKGVYGMKFFKGQENDRLYCKQFSNSQESLSW